MDAERVDTLLRALSTAPSRRGLTRAVAGLVLGGPLGSCLASPETAAKKRGGNNGTKTKKKKSCPPCKKKRDGKCKANKPDGTACENGGQCQGGSCVLPPTPGPTCTDGLKNGSETGVDCGGGACPRCGNGQGCASGNDCEGGLCSNRTCLACSGPNSCGPGCFCAPGSSGPICADNNVINLGLGSTCTQCPGGALAYCSQEGLIAYCVYRCGA